MHEQIQAQLVARFVDHLSRGTTDTVGHNLQVSAAHYVDPNETQHEVDALFKRQPLLIALTPDIPEIGDYLTHEAADTSLLIVRDDNLKARAFVNACRHRGARIAEGRGNAKSFSCPFHAWNWSRNGTLLSRPNSLGGFDSINDSFSTLNEVSCLEIGGMIFVQLLGGDIDSKVRILLGDFFADLENLQIENTEYFDDRTTERDCNYKFIMDGFCESYHIAALHKETISPYYYTVPGLTDVSGRTVRMIGVRRSIDKEFDKPEADRRILPHGTTQYLIGANTILTHQVDHIQLWRIYPVQNQPDRCRVQFALYWPKPTSEATRKKSQFNIDVIWKVTTEEDFPQSMAIHKNLASGSLPELIFGRNEPALVHYHQQIATAINSRHVVKV